MPLRAFFVLEHPASAALEYYVIKDVAMPLRAFFVLELGRPRPAGGGISSGRNALTGIFCFGTELFAAAHFRYTRSVAMPLRAFFVLELEYDKPIRAGKNNVAMPLRAFFVLERAFVFRSGPKVSHRRNALTGIFCFGTFACICPVSRRRRLCRNALTGIFCFGTHIHVDTTASGNLVAMPLRAFFVLEQFQKPQ